MVFGKTRIKTYTNQLQQAGESGPTLASFWREGLKPYKEGHFIPIIQDSVIFKKIHIAQTMHPIFLYHDATNLEDP